MNRRKFIRNSCASCIGLSLLSGFLSSCKSTKYLEGDIGNDGIKIPLYEYETMKNGRNKFLIVRNEQLKFPIVVFLQDQRTPTALWMECSHQGAELQVSDNFLVCPAHGSEFNNRGEVINGPAMDNLRSFPVTILSDSLFIDLRKQ